MSGTPDRALRRWVHLATGLCALLLGLAPDPWHLVLAGGGVLLGWVVFPLTGLDRFLRRPGEPFLGGLRTYPVAVFLLVWLLPRAGAAAAWGILAFGDVAAAWVGGTVRAPAVFGHPKATWAGSGALVIGGALAAFLLGGAVAALAASGGGVEAGPAPAAWVCALAALAAGLADLLPLPPDDNLPLATAAGAVLYFLGGAA